MVATRWFAERNVTYALQRPDFHRFGTATTTASASKLLDDLQVHHCTDRLRLEGVKQ